MSALQSDKGHHYTSRFSRQPHQPDIDTGSRRSRATDVHSKNPTKGPPPSARKQMKEPPTEQNRAFH
ncbi:hypothetical protein ZHAS_00010588 [Anopheles sinensis]|uniref:Uncharacterized protein n=1 Tax=Anopheles sinensis TaxID=74873 RepID=A0A084VXZ4_ANOSI|nr:hypothetical protein ZHAS_00010588 [Anopheles sinensis]